MSKKPSSFIKISYVQNGRAIDNIKIDQGSLEFLTLKNVMKMKLKDAEKTPLIIAKGEAKEFLSRYL